MYYVVITRTLTRYNESIIFSQFPEHETCRLSYIYTTQNKGKTRVQINLCLSNVQKNKRQHTVYATLYPCVIIIKVSVFYTVQYYCAQQNSAIKETNPKHAKGLGIFLRISNDCSNVSSGKCLHWNQSTEANLQLGIFHSFFVHLVKFLVVCIRKAVFPISHNPYKYEKDKSIEILDASIFSKDTEHQRKVINNLVHGFGGFGFTDLLVIFI